MSRINFITVIVALIFGSCSKGDEDNIEVSFEKSNFEVINQVQDLSIKLNLSEEAPKDVKFDLRFGGTATEPHDYQALDKLSIRKGDLGSEFIIQIKLSPDNTDSRTIEISLSLPSGYATGDNPKTEIIINSK